MRVKVGNTWYSPEPGQPIMVELTEGDRESISEMPNETTRYAAFASEDATDAAQMTAWMDEGL